MTFGSITQQPTVHGGLCLEGHHIEDFSLVVVYPNIIYARSLLLLVSCGHTITLPLIWRALPFEISWISTQLIQVKFPVTVYCSRNNRLGHDMIAGRMKEAKSQWGEFSSPRKNHPFCRKTFCGTQNSCLLCTVNGWAYRISINSAELARWVDKGRGGWGRKYKRIDSHRLARVWMTGCRYATLFS